jgi:general secretion pathway protein G
LEGDKSKQKGGENIMGKQKAKILQNIHNKRGFTLVEVLVVTAIIAILAAVLIPRLLGYTDRAREARAISDIRTIKTIIEAYTADEGSGIYPSGMSLDFATGLYKKGPDYIGTILQKHGIKWYDIMTPGGITDPWGKPYFYARYVGADDNQIHYILFSTGKDGKIQTPDDIYTTDTASPTIGSIPDYQAIFNSVQSAASTYVPE